MEEMLNRARGLLGSGSAAEAWPLLHRLCQDRPDWAEAWFLLGASHHMLGRLPEGLAAFERATQLAPTHVQALNARASLLGLLGRPSEALAIYDSLRALVPSDARIAVNAAIALEQLERLDDALVRYELALQLDPRLLPALLNRSALLLRLGRPAQALVDADRALAAYPESVDARYNRTGALLALDRNEEALLAAGQVVAAAPGHIGGHASRGLALSCLGQIEEAREAFQRARAIDPTGFRTILQAAWRAGPGERGGWEYEPDDIPDPRAIYLVRGVQRLARCEWGGRDVFLARFESLIRAGIADDDPVCDWSLPFATLLLPLTQEVAAGVIKAVAARVVAKTPPPLVRVRVMRTPGEPLRIGYLSAGVRRHPSAFLNAPTIQGYDAQRVRAYAYVLNPPDGSREAQWFAEGCVAARPCHGLPDEAIARQIRADGIHILLDVSSFLDYSRPEVLRLRPAPINAAYMGALLPSGSDSIDYRIVDRSMLDAASTEFQSERVVTLARTIYAYGTGPLVPDDTPDRVSIGLPRAGTVLCCFNGAYKIDPVMFGAWMRILAQSPGSVLWLLGEGDVERNLRAEAQARGVDPQRLVFAPRVSIAAHLARSRLADLFLDTLPCNAHTTAAEAIYCGVPVLTLPGNTMAGRCAVSIVRAAGLPDLVASSLAEYEATAVHLATDGTALAAVKTRLAAHRAACPLWDARGLARSLEHAFEIMWDRYARGLAPASFEVSETA